MTFLYTGESQLVDMTFTRGNKTIRDQLTDGKAIHLFEKAHMGHVRYVCELAYVRHTTQPGHDAHGASRQIIVFELRRL